MAERIYATLTEIFRDVFDRDDVVPTAAMTAADVPEWDSLTHIRLMVAVEAAFGVRFTSGEIASLPDVGSLVALIEGKTAAR